MGTRLSIVTSVPAAPIEGHWFGMQLLKRERVGRHDDFFELGGDSTLDAEGERRDLVDGPVEVVGVLGKASKPTREAAGIEPR